ncbi:MAG: hypothetical protein ACE37K_06315 [Planctomycetota bacterium]
MTQPGEESDTNGFLFGLCLYLGDVAPDQRAALFEGARGEQRLHLVELGRDALAQFGQRRELRFGPCGAEFALHLVAFGRELLGLAVEPERLGDVPVHGEHVLANARDLLVERREAGAQELPGVRGAGSERGELLLDLSV